MRTNSDSHAQPPMVDAVPLESSSEHESSLWTASVTKFLRSLHVLLRSVRLYQRNHPRVGESLEMAERDLRAVLAHAPALGIRINREAILVAGREGEARALPDWRGDLRVLAIELQNAGIASLVFLRRIHLGELALFAHELDEASRTGGRALSVSVNWREWALRNQIAGLEINAALPGEGQNVLAYLMAALPAASGDLAEPDAPGFEQAQAALGLLAGFSARLQALEKQTPKEAAAEVRAWLAAADAPATALLAHFMRLDPPLESDRAAAYLCRIGDAVALSFLTAEFRAGRLTASEARQKMLELCEADGSEAGAESRAEERLQRFWSALTISEIAAVASGPDAWLLPAAVLRAHLTSLLETECHAGRANTARQIFADYVRCLQSEKTSARRAVATALIEWKDLLPRLWAHGEMHDLVSGLIGALARESSPPVAVLLATALEVLAGAALEQGRYEEFENITSGLEQAMASQGQAIQPLAKRLRERHWPALLEAATANPALHPALARLLRREPGRLLDRVGEMLLESEPAGGLAAGIRLIRACGEPVLRALETDLCATRRQPVARAIKLLAQAAPERLALALRQTLRHWDWNLQDLAVTELARHSEPAVRKQVAQIFLELLGTAHPHVAPAMVDAIALAQETSAIPRLMEIAGKEDAGAADTFIRIKAIEALGRLQAREAAAKLAEIATKRSGLTYVFPAGLRSAAEEALALLEGKASAVLQNLPGSRAGARFAQPRRYRRVALSTPLSAEIESGKKTPARIRALALGGALVETGSRLAVGESLQIEIHAGLGRIRSTAVIRNWGPQGYGIEFVHMGHEDREKLRRRLLKLLE